MPSTRKRIGMLTRQQIRRAARLESQVGELRPGYIRDGACALEGPSGVPRSLVPAKSAVSRRLRSGGKRVRIALAFEEDPESGERRTVRK
jgi:hypothetical protein